MINMLFIVFLGILSIWTVSVVPAHSDHSHGFERDILDGCANEFDMIGHAEYWDQKPSETPENFKCFVKCLVTKMGFLDVAGYVNGTHLIEQIKASAPTLNAAEFIAKCEEIGEDASCESVANVFMCIRSELIRQHKH